MTVQAGPDTYLQLEFWDENKSLIREAARLILKAGREDRVILGNPQNKAIWRMCSDALPGAPRILPMSEARPDLALHGARSAEEIR